MFWLPLLTAALNESDKNKKAEQQANAGWRMGGNSNFAQRQATGEAAPGEEDKDKTGLLSGILGGLGVGK